MRTNTKSASSRTARRAGGVAVAFSLGLAGLATASPILTGTDSGGGNGHVKLFDGATFAEQRSFFAFPGFTGGVRVATGDIDADGHADLITGVDPNGHLKVFAGRTGGETHSFFTFPGFTTGGVLIGSGDVNGDGRADILAAASVSGHVKVFDSNLNLLRSFLAFPSFNGDVSVASGDINGDGFDEIFTAAAAHGHVKVFDGRTNSEMYSFLAFPGLVGTTYVAAGDVNGDGRADIITGAGSGTGGHVKVFDGVTLQLQQSFFAFPGFTGGVRVAVGDVNDDGFNDIIAGTGPGGSLVRVFDGQSHLERGSFQAFGAFTGGVFVAAPIPKLVPEPAPALLAPMLAAALLLMRRRRLV